MKKLVVMMALVMACGAAFAQTNQVLSKNAVGYVRVDTEGGKQYLVAPSFESMDAGGNTIENVIPAAASGLGGGTKAYLWDAVSQSYRSETLQTFPTTAWNPGTNVLARGSSFWLVPSGTDTNSIYFMGEVPSETNAVKSIAVGLSFLSGSYPVDTPITNTTLIDTLGGGDKAFFFSADVGSWVSETVQTFPSLDWNPGTNVIAAGYGVVIKSTAGGSWDELKPYTWP